MTEKTTIINPEKRPNPPVKTSYPLWSVIGLVVFLASFLVSYLIMIQRGSGDSWGWGRMAQAFLVFGGMMTLSFIASCIGIARKESHAYLSFIVFGLSVLPAGYFFFFFFLALLGRYASQQ